MKCIIIDDEKMARVILKTLCNEIQSLEVLEDFPNAIEAIKYLNKNRVDLIFLDIHMPGFNGLDFIRSLKNPPKIILITSDPNFAIEAFEYDFIIDYLLKPLQFDRFKKAIEKSKTKNLTLASNETNSSRKAIENDFYISIDRRLIKIDLPSIYLIEAKGDYIKN
jgi:two-component system response regulator LytT